MTQRVRNDPSVGPERYCRRCAEWWPDTDDFWIRREYHAGDVAIVRKDVIYVRRTDGVTRTCRACHARANPATYEARRSAARVRNATVHVCKTASCIVLIPLDRELCSYCRGVTAGPLTIAMLEARITP